ncbi:MAG: aminoacyl-tRNA hydrolase [Symbiobacteriaceae bacterium]|nr:aminoacyl-tRNA hydrolase [Symbiobacteriaceae bacterium]
MRLIVGLGNPGSKYAMTRHNFGFRALDRLAEQWSTGIRQTRFNSLYASLNYEGEQYLLVKPLSFMNNSGIVVQSWIRYNRVALSDLLVIYDDLDIDLGRIRLRDGGSAGGHRGMISIISSLDSDKFPRFRLGIGPRPEEIDAAEYVIRMFHPQESKIVDQVIKAVPDIVVCWSHEGLTQAMSRYNAWSVDR